MSKFYGAVGYAVTPVESAPGIWVESYVERYYPGELMRNSRRMQGESKRNVDIDISNEVSIVADPYAYENFHAIRYVEFMNSKWKVTSVEIQYPRIRLTLGGLFHGDETTTS